MVWPVQVYAVLAQLVGSLWKVGRMQITRSVATRGEEIETCYTSQCWGSFAVTVG